MRGSAQVTGPVMLRFRSALDAAFGARIERVVLFRSWPARPAMRRSTPPKR